eukprot:768640-Hanusia_phi.AAC.6
MRNSSLLALFCRRAGCQSVRLLLRTRLTKIPTLFSEHPHPAGGQWGRALEPEKHSPHENQGSSLRPGSAP